MSEKKIYNGVDLSRHNIVTSMKDLKKEGVDFVIIRIGGSNGSHYKDPKFELYYNTAKDAGLHVGCYYDTGRGFVNTTAGINDAVHMLSLLKDHQFDYPIYMDIETAAPVYRQGITDAAIAFGNVLEANNYFVGIYASDISGFKDRLQLERVKKFSLWVARYGKRPEYVKDFAIWQKSSTGEYKAMKTKVDLDECYVNFPNIIKKKHFNGY